MSKSTKNSSLFLAFYNVTVFFQEDLPEGFAIPPRKRSQFFVICAESQSEALRIGYDLTPECFRVIGSKCELNDILINL
jgi:hypothetical protein